MSVEETTERLISILCEAATAKEPVTYKTGFWGRAQVTTKPLTNISVSFLEGFSMIVMCILT